MSSDAISRILDGIPIPPMARIRQHLPEETLPDVAAAARTAMDREVLRKKIRPGMRVAITAGSRGIFGMKDMLREAAAFVRSCGGDPFLIPAMGSHGGATADGQRDVLTRYGITEETVGAPIRATMETVKIGELPDNTPVYIDRYAAEADGIILVNRIKCHTGFRGRYESGLFKMMAIGLGKQYGAQTVHGRGADKMGESIELFGKAILQNANVLLGLAVIENAIDMPYQIVALTPQEIIDQEPDYLTLARQLMPRILFDNLDVVIVDYFGKEISGAGVDPNVTHTYKYASGIPLDGRARQVAVLDLTKQSHGNAHGVGVMDLITKRFFDKIDPDITYANSLTTGGTEVPKIPMYLPNQRMCIQAAIHCAQGADREKLRMVRIRDTMHLKEIQVSPALLEEARGNPAFDILEEPTPLVFDSQGDLFPSK